MYSRQLHPNMHLIKMWSSSFKICRTIPLKESQIRRRKQRKIRQQMPLLNRPKQKPSLLLKFTNQQNQQFYNGRCRGSS